MEIKEIWKDIIGYENLYQCSNLGRIKSLWFGKEKILKQIITNQNYCLVGLCKQKKRKMYLVHRLVATAFIPNIENKPEIDHIDTNRQNNCVSNLHWVTKKENMNNPITLIKSSQAQRGKKLSSEHIEKLRKINTGNKYNAGKKQSQEHISNKTKARQKPIVQLLLNGEFIKNWCSAKQASVELNINNGDITHCCKGKCNSAGKYRWKYLSDYINEQINYLNELKEYRDRLNDILKKAS